MILDEHQLYFLVLTDVGVEKRGQMPIFLRYCFFLDKIA